MRRVAASLIDPPRLARTPWWLWPNLLALDAPFVAVLWQTLFAETLHIHLRIAALAALALTCWLIYATDYLLDSGSTQPTSKLSRRHEFFRTHRNQMLFLLAGGAALVIHISKLLPSDTMWHGAILALAVLTYLAVTHIGPVAWRARWPRELAVAACFSAGTSLSSWSAGPHCILPTAIFGLLCWLNMSAIEYWEWHKLDRSSAQHPSHSASLLARNLAPAALVLLLFTLCVPVPAPLKIAAVASEICFLFFGRVCGALSPGALRVAADAALCTPILILVFHA